MIKPVLCYGSEVWRFEISERIENVHLKVCKKFFFKFRTCTFHTLLEVNGVDTLSILNFCICIKYWIKLTRMDQNRHPGKCYKMFRNLY